MKSTELTWAERAFRFVAQAIPPILASGYVSRSSGLWLAGVFLFTLVVAAASAYVSSKRSRKPSGPLRPEG